MQKLRSELNLVIHNYTYKRTKPPSVDGYTKGQDFYINYGKNRPTNGFCSSWPKKQLKLNTCLLKKKV